MAAGIVPTIGPEPLTSLPQWLHLPIGADLHRRVAVHVDGYPARVLESLRESFPALTRCLGDDEFAALARRYAAAVPLASYNLNDAGAELSQFLRDDPAVQRLPFLADLAALEWRITRAFHAYEQPPLEPRRLDWSLAEWERAVLVFQPAVALVASRWPILDLWNAPADRGELAPVAQPRPQQVLVRRAGLTVRAELISTAESHMLRSLLDGGSLGDAAAQAENGDAPEAFEASFGRWIRYGLITDAHLRQPDLVA
jgi:hypothetical protein